MEYSMSPNRGFLRTIIATAVMLVVLISFSGCSDDDLSTPEATFGTVEIVMPTENIGATWHLYGPGDSFRHGNSDEVLLEMPSGQYTIIWTAVEEWTPPAPARRSLTADATLTLNGVYEDKAPGSNFVLVPTGAFVMGSERSRYTLPDSTLIPAEMGRDVDEKRHHVGLGQSFYLCKTEITNQDYVEQGNWAIQQGIASTTESSLLDGLDGSTIELLNFDFPDTPIDVQDGMLRLKKPEYANRPLVEVTWYGAAAYCDWISLRGLLLGRSYDHDTWEVNGGDVYNSTFYRLPTEAEWEYACRAGTTTAFWSGDILTGSCDEAALTGAAWFCGNAGNSSHDVGTKAANPWGLFDMHGNVWEWCNDFYGRYNVDPGYDANPDTVIYLIDPVGPAEGQNRIIRGGRWLLSSSLCRSAGRMMGTPDYKGINIGFRPAITDIP
jgi:formylglycine-generating enzyme required for sulfatase activity